MLCLCLRPASTHRRFACQCLLVNAACAMLLGCLAVPVRAPTHIQGPGGKVKALDTKFLTPAVTTRAEVHDKLADIGVAPDFERFYWARWGQSSWAVAWAVGGGYSGTGGIDRLWGSENLIVRFDETGTVRSVTRASDRELPALLRTVLKAEVPLGPAWPIKLQAEHRHHQSKYEFVDISLSPDIIEFREPFNPKHSFAFSPADVIGMQTPQSDAGDTERISVRQTLVLGSKTPSGRKLVLRMEPSAFVWLLRYMNQYCPNAK